MTYITMWVNVAIFHYDDSNEQKNNNYRQMMEDLANGDELFGYIHSYKGSVAKVGTMCRYVKHIFIYNWICTWLYIFIYTLVCIRYMTFITYNFEWYVCDWVILLRVNGKSPYQLHPILSDPISETDIQSSQYLFNSRSSTCTNLHKYELIHINNVYLL
jgi:hypothetical protein